VTPDRVGDLAVVLHSHMPYVEGFGTYPFGEEWLFDAVLRSYAPVLEVADRVTIGVTPVLADQLEAPGVAHRLREFARRYRIEACEADAADIDPPYRPACRAEAERYRRALARLEEAGDDLTELFRRPVDAGRVALLASTATHAVLPLVATRGGQRLQIEIGLRSHRRRFGEPAGFWLPECAFAPGLDQLLAEHDAVPFCLDLSAAEGALDALAPLLTPAGATALTIDWEAVAWLWSLDGYPADPAHADFHRRSLRGTRPWSIAGDPYDPEAAEATARRQAGEFVEAVRARLDRYRATKGKPGLITFAIDTELLGHWWYEGPAWLAEVIAIAPSRGVDLVTVPEAVRRHESERRPLVRSSWGEGKDLRTWDSPEVADLAWAARRMELRLLRALGEGLRGATADRATRELLALQASDWAFLDRRRQAGDYPFHRASDHARTLLEVIDSADPADPRLRNLAPDLTLAPLLEP
jgi:1,4-alpha-glucan branching enzyme